MPDVFAQLLKDLEDQNNRFNVDPDTLEQEDDMFAKLLRELEEQQIELQRQEEERQEKLAEIKKQDKENAYIDEDFTFEEVKDTIIHEENANRDPNAVYDKNTNGSSDLGLMQVNDRWINRGLTTKGLPSFETNTDKNSKYYGTPDPVYAKVQEYMAEQIPNWGMMSDEFRKQELFDEENNIAVAEIIYNGRGGEQWSKWPDVLDSMQAKQTSANVDTLARNAFSGDMPTLDDIASQVNLDPNSMESQIPALQRNNPKYKEQALTNNEYVGTYRNLVNSFYRGIANYETTRAFLSTEFGLDPEERVKFIAHRQAVIKGLKSNKDQEKFFKSETFGEAMKIAVLNPLDVIAPLTLESLAQFLPTYLNIAPVTVGTSTVAGAAAGSFIPGAGTAAGAGVGFTVGNITAAGLAGFSMEYTGKILEIMQEEGVDITNPDELLEGLQNERLMAKARKKGVQKGIPIAILDAVSGGVAGRFISPALKTGTKVSKALRATGEVGIQATLGMTGEVAGALSAGEEISPPAVLAEGFGEVGQAVPMGALNIWNQRRKERGETGTSELPTADDKSALKQDIINRGATVTNELNPETGRYEVTLISGDKQVQKMDFDTKEQAAEVETALLDKIADVANDKTIEFEGERPPIMEEEGVTVEAKPWFSKEADAIREKIRQAEEAADLSRAVPTSDEITENLEKIYGSVETVEEDVADQKVNYKIMNTKRLRKELRDKGKSDKGSKRALIVRLEVEVARLDVRKGVLSELNDRSAKLTRLQEKIREEIKFENELSAPDPARLDVLNKDLAVAVSQKDRVVQDIHKIQGVKPKVKAKVKAAPVKDIDTAKYEHYKAKLERGEKLNSKEAAEWGMFLEEGFADVTPEVVEPVAEEAPAVTPEAVHKAAEGAGMKWDDDADFMALSKRVTGKERIDDMTSDERAKLITEIEAPAVEEAPDIKVVNIKPKRGSKSNPDIPATSLMIDGVQYKFKKGFGVDESLLPKEAQESLARRDAELEKMDAERAEAERGKQEAPDIKQQDLDTRVNTELTEDEQSEVYVDDIRNPNDTTKQLAWVKNIKTNSINGFKKAAKKLQSYIDSKQDSENDQVIENVQMAEEAIGGMEIILQGRNLEFDDDFNIVDLGVDEVTPTVEEAPAEAGLLPQLEQSLVRKYGKNYKNNPAFQEYLDENDLVDIRELDKEGQKNLHSDLTVRDIDTGFELGFLGITPQNLKLLGDTIIGAGRFTFQTLPKFVQKQGKALGVTSDNFKQKWDEYSADPGKAPQKLKAYMKKVFTHMKKWYGKSKEYVVEYLKSPKIGAMIEVVGEAPAVEAKPKKELDLSILFEPVPVKYYRNKQGKISINTKSLTGANQKQAASIYNWMWEFGTSKTDFVKAWSRAASEKERGGLSRRQYEIQVLSPLHSIAKEKFIADVKSRHKKAQDKFGLLQTFDSGKHMMDWYDNFYDYMVEKFGSEADLAIDFIAITSAGVDLSANIGFGLKGYAQYKVNDKLDTGLYPTNTRKNLQNAIDNHRNRNNPNYKPRSIGGLKVTNFAQALRKDENAVVLDLWMAREFGLWKMATPNNVKPTRPNPNNPSETIKGTAVWIYDKKGNGFKARVVGVGKRKAIVEWGRDKQRKAFSYKEMAVIKDTFTDPEYLQYEQVIKELAEKRGVTPRQMQAGIWFGIREGHSPMHPGQPHLDSAYFEDLLTARMNGHINKKGEKMAPWSYKGYNVNQLKELSPDISDALNSFSSFPSPAQMDLVKTMLVDAGRFTYDQLSPAMQKLGNRLGINSENFKMRFTQYANNARNMTDSSKKWFKKVMNVMKNWFKKMGKKLIDSDPAQKLYNRLENLVVNKFVSDDEITSMLQDTMDKAGEKVKGKDRAEVKSEAETIKKIRTEPDPEKSDGVISAKAGMLGRGFHLISERLKNIDLKGGGGLALARALRLTYEKYKLYVQQDMTKLQPVLDALRKVEKANIEDYRELTYGLMNGEYIENEKGEFEPNFWLKGAYNIMNKHDIQIEFGLLREVLDSLYYKAMGMTVEEEKTYRELKESLPAKRKEIPNKYDASWTVKNIKEWLDNKKIKYTSKDEKAALLNKVGEDKAAKKKLDKLVESEKLYKDLRGQIWIEMGYRPGYFPRNVRDYKGLMVHLGINEDRGAFSDALQREAKKHTRVVDGKVQRVDKEDLPLNIRIKVLNSLTKAGTPIVRTTRDKHSKSRKLAEVTKESSAFYDDPYNGLIEYIENVHESIHRKMLFNMKGDTDIGTTEDQIGAFINGLLIDKKLSEEDQQEVLDIFKARFAYNPLKSKWIPIAKNLTYISVMLQIPVTITQLGDVILGTSFRSKDPYVFAKSFSKAVLGNIPKINKLIKSKITAADMGLNRIAAEYTTKASKLGKTLNTGFAVIGFKWLDMIAKESTVNAAIESMSKLAKRDKLLDNEKYGVLIKDALGDEATINKVVAMLKNLDQMDTIPDEVISLAYWVLLEHQPIAESELPEKYLTSPEAALFYQLKTYSLKQLNLLRSNTYDLARRGHKKQALKNFLWLTPLMVMAGAAPDALKDWLAGKEVDFDDIFWENLFKMFLMSKYSSERAFKDWKGWAAGQFAFTGVIANIGKDIDYAMRWFSWQSDPRKNNPPSDSPKYGVRSTRHIPLIGMPMYTGIPMLGIDGARGRKAEFKHVIKKYDDKKKETGTLSKHERTIRNKYRKLLREIEREERAHFRRYRD